MDQMHINNDLWSVIQNFLDPEAFGIWKLSYSCYQWIPVKKTLPSFINLERVIVKICVENGKKFHRLLRLYILWFRVIYLFILYIYLLQQEFIYLFM